MSGDLFLRCVAIVLAADSTRLPGKHFKRIGDYSLLEFIFERLKSCNGVDFLMLATTRRSVDDQLADRAKSIGYNVSRGEYEDVLSRFTSAAETIGADIIIKVNGDCPFISSEVINNMVPALVAGDAQFVTAKAKYCGLPVGVGAEVISASALSELSTKAPYQFKSRLRVTYLKRATVFHLNTQQPS